MDSPYGYHQFAGRNVALDDPVVPNTWLEIWIKDVKAMKRYYEQPFIASNGVILPAYRCEICYGDLATDHMIPGFNPKEDINASRASNLRGAGQAALGSLRK